MDVYIHEFWAHSDTEMAPGTQVPVKQNVVRFKTVYLSHRPYGPKATAQICLSRLDGAGTARCVISGYSFFVQANPKPLYVFPGSYSGPTDTMEIVLAGPGSITMNNAHSITFQLGVSNVFAYATATIFVEPVGRLQRIVTSVAELLQGPRLASASAPDPSGQGSLMHVAYDRRTGEILQSHDAVAVGGARLPDEAELARVSASLFGDPGAESDRVAITSVRGRAFDIGGKYRIDPQTGRLSPPDPS